MDHPPAPSHEPDQLDSAWKCALDCMLEEFLQLCFPAIAAGLDFARPVTVLDTELHQPTDGTSPAGRACHADRVLRCHTLDGTEICLHIEVQCQRDEHFPQRMFVYHALLYAKFRLPIISLAILGDQRRNWRPCKFGYSLSDCELHLRFGVVKLLDLEPRLPSLITSGDPFAWFVSAHLKTIRTKGEPFARMRAKCRLTEILYDRDLPEARLEQLLELLDRLMQLPSEQDLQYRQELAKVEEAHMLTLTQRIKYDALRRGLERGTALGIRLGMRTGHTKGLVQGIEQGIEQGISQGIEQGIGQGIEQGIELGREEGRRLALLELIEQRFGPIPAQLLAQLQNAGAEDVARWSKRFCDAATLEELLA